MCEAEYDWYRRSFCASVVFEFEGRRNFPFCKADILFSFYDFSLLCETKKFVS